MALNFSLLFSQSSNEYSVYPTGAKFWRCSDKQDTKRLCLCVADNLAVKDMLKRSL